MNKLFTKVAALSVGLAMAIGVGVAIGGQKAPVRAKAADGDIYSGDFTTVATHSYTQNKTFTLSNKNWTTSVSQVASSVFYLGCNSNNASKGVLNNNSTFSDVVTVLAANDSGYNSNKTTAHAYAALFNNSCSNVGKIEMAWAGTNNNNFQVYLFGYSGSSWSLLTKKSLTAQSADSLTYSAGSAESYSKIVFVARPGAANSTASNKTIRLSTFKITSASDTLTSINLSATEGGTTALTTGTVKTGKTLQVYLTGVYSSAGAVNKTSEATWNTGDSSVATVTAGLITGVSVGETTISASFGGKSAVSLTLTVTQGPAVSLSRTQVSPFLESETKSDITITTLGFSSTPTISALSNSANLTASILQNGNLQIAAASNISANETVDVTVTGDDGQDTASAVLKVYLKAPVFTLSAASINIRPSASPVVVTSTIENFGSNYTMTAVGSNNSAFTVSLSETTVTVTPVAEGSGNLTATVTSENGLITRQIIVPVTIADVLEYNLVTDDSTLTEGSKLLFVNGTNNYAMSSQSGSYRTAASVTISGGVISGPSSDVKVVELEGETGEWYLKVSDGYLTYGSSNSIDTVASKGDADSWTISIDGSNNATIAPESGRLISFNNSANPKRFACYTSTQTNGAVQIYGILEPAKTITASRIGTVGTVSASTGDLDWTIEDFEYQVQYNSQSTWYTIESDELSFSVNVSVPSITQSGSMYVDVTGSYRETTATASNVVATLTYVDISELYTIERLYTATLSETYTSDGVYMGEVADGYIFMNGEYGILVYDKSHALSLTIGSSYAITGTLTEYKGLREIDDEVVVLLTNTDRRNNVEAPETYEVVGGESNPNVANRKTALTGYVKSMSSTELNKNSTVVVNVNGEDVTVYVKAAEATEKNMTALSDNKDANEEKTSDFILISMEGFTSWFNGFQVSLTEVVVPDDTYTIASFARSLLKMTLSICTGGQHDNTTNKSALVAIWGQLAGASYYGKLTDAKKTTLAGGTADSSIVVPSTEAGIDAMSDADAIGAALYRYDFCTAKYNLNAFISGRTLSVSFSRIAIFGQALDSVDTTLVVLISSMVALTAVGGYFFLRRKKEQ